MTTIDPIKLAKEAKAWSDIDAYLDGGDHPIECPGCAVSTEFIKNSDRYGRRRYVCKGRDPKCTKSFAWKAAEDMLKAKYDITRPSEVHHVFPLRSASAPRPPRASTSQAGPSGLAVYPVAPAPARVPGQPVILSRTNAKPLLTIPRAQGSSASVTLMQTVVEEAVVAAPSRAPQSEARPAVYVPQTQAVQPQALGNPVRLIPQSQPDPVAMVPMPLARPVDDAPMSTEGPSTSPRAVAPLVREDEQDMEVAVNRHVGHRVDDDIRNTLVRIVDKMEIFQEIILDQGRKIKELQHARLPGQAALPARPALPAPVFRQPARSEEEEYVQRPPSPEYPPPALAQPPISRHYAQVLQDTVRAFPAGEQDGVKEALSVVRIFAPKPPRPNYKAEDTFSYRAVYVTGFAWEPVKKIRDALYALRFQRSRIRNICWLGHYLVEVVVDQDYHHKFVDQVSAIPGLKVRADFTATGSGEQDQEQAVDRFLARAAKIAKTTKVGLVRDFFTAWHAEIADAQQGRGAGDVFVLPYSPALHGHPCSPYRLPTTHPASESESEDRASVEDETTAMDMGTTDDEHEVVEKPIEDGGRVPACRELVSPLWSGVGAHAHPNFTLHHPSPASDSAQQECEDSEEDQGVEPEEAVVMEHEDERGRVGWCGVVWGWGDVDGRAASPVTQFALQPTHPNCPTPNPPRPPTPNQMRKMM